MTAIDFNPTTHEYSVAGQIKRSTTQIITDLGLAPPYADNPTAKEFGTWVHKACELAAWDRLDDAATSPVIMPYVNGFRGKARELKIRPIATELLVYHGLLDYCGTLDLLCWINDGDLALIDFKCGQPPPCVELQTAGYVLAVKYMYNNGKLAQFWPHLGYGGFRRFSMQLLADRAILRECPDPFDLTAWEGAVNLWKWKRFRRDQRA